MDGLEEDELEIEVINDSTLDIIESSFVFEYDKLLFNKNTLILPFIIPDSNVTIKYNDKFKKEEDYKMEPQLNQPVIIDKFEIPEAIAKRLSELLTIQTIREKILDQNIENIVKYEQIEKMLIPVVSEVEALKTKITRDYVPEKYRSDEYMWNYDGYDIDGCIVQVLKI